MTGVLLFGVLLSRADTGGCPPAVATSGPGSSDPFRAPASAAVESNAEAKKLYREGKWESARQKYRAALAADGDFLAPRLNIACSFVRQERFAEAVAEAVLLIESAYVPWGREILEAADMGALRPRPEMKQIEAALARARLAWGEGLVDSVLFVARVRTPLALRGEGVLVLGRQQEIFAWSPATGRYRQLTAEDGRVLALVRSMDGRHVLYATAEKLVRPPGGAPAALRGVVLRTIDLPTMTRSGPVALSGDVRRIDLAFVGTQPAASVESDQINGTFVVEEGRVLRRPLRLRGATRLTATGVSAGAPMRMTTPCPISAVDRRAAGAAPAIDLKVGGKGERWTIPAVQGAGLLGLPLD